MYGGWKKSINEEGEFFFKINERVFSFIREMKVDVRHD